MGFFQKLQEKIDGVMIELNKPNLASKANFFRLMAVSQKAGLWVRDSLKSLQQWEKSKWMLLIINDMIDKLTEWASLAEAMETQSYFFHSDEIELIRSTEITGNMTQTLEEIADSLEESQEINAKVKKASTYPAMMIWLTIVAVAVLLIKVFPTIIDMYWDPADLPGITKFFLVASDYLRANWYKLVAVFIAIVIAYNLAYSKWLLFKIWVDKLLLTIPIVKNVVKLFYMSRFTSLLAQFYEAWVSPIISFKLLAWIFDNFHYKRKMIEIRNSINAWFSIYDSLEWTELFDPILIQIINVWENTWSLPTVLNRISPFYASTLKNNIDALMATLEPLLMCFIAGMVWSLLWAIYLPMADMVNQIWLFILFNIQKEADASFFINYFFDILVHSHSSSHSCTSICVITATFIFRFINHYSFSSQ